MSSGDWSAACGCYSFAADCRTPGSGGTCPKHKDATFEQIKKDNEGKKNWGAIT